MNYFYRLSDLRESSALYLAGDKDTDTPEAKRNSKTLCAALVTLGVVDSTEAAQKLIDNPAGSSTARRLLSRFVSDLLAGWLAQSVCGWLCMCSFW